MVKWFFGKHGSWKVLIDFQKLAVGKKSFLSILVGQTFLSHSLTIKNAGLVLLSQKRSIGFYHSLVNVRMCQDLARGSHGA